MKPFLFSTILFLVLGLVFPTVSSAQKFPSLDKSPLDIAAFPKRGANKVIRVTYSRPFKKERDIFGAKVKFGKVWRLGANEATEITFYQDVSFGGQAVQAGTYALFAIPNESEWTLILNSKLNQWGAFTYKEKNDVSRATAQVSSAEKVLENFTITFDKTTEGATMYLGWDKTIASLPIAFE